MKYRVAAVGYAARSVAALIFADTILYDTRFFFFWLLWIGCSRCIDNSRSAIYVIISILAGVPARSLATSKSKKYFSNDTVLLFTKVFKKLLELRWLFPTKSVELVNRLQTSSHSARSLHNWLLYAIVMI